MNARCWLALATLSAPSLACSRLAPPPPTQECVDDSDCQTGFVCQAAQCRNGELDPPILYIGLDVQERTTSLRTEVAACDEEVVLETRSVSEIVVPRERFIQNLDLSVLTALPPDGEPPSLDEVLPARFQLSQLSRFARGVPTRPVPFPTVNSDDTLAPTVVPWPRYHPDNRLPPELGRDGHILWTTVPDKPEERTAPALRYQLLVPPLSADDTPCESPLDCCPEDEPECDFEDVQDRCVGVCRLPDNPRITYSYIYDTRCDRGLEGQVVSLLGSPLATEVVVRHADAEGDELLTIPPLESPQPTTCRNDSDCVNEEMVCNRGTGSCELRLAGRRAGSGFTDDSGTFTTQVYTYCDDEDDVSLDRTFTATVTQSLEQTPARVTPTVVFEFQARFRPELNPDSNPISRVAGEFCMPDLGPPGRQVIELRGTPLTLASDDTGISYRCCDIDCLPSTADAASGRPPLPVETCNGLSTSGAAPLVRLEAQIPYDEFEDEYEQDDNNSCLPPVVDDGVVGVLRRTASCDTESCEATDVALGQPERPRPYTVRIESPTGSLLGSRVVELDLDGEPVAIDLPNRRLLRGRITLPDDLCDDPVEGCGSSGALVLAERLALAGETVETTPGPYYHEVQTYFDPETELAGSYVLPLDPGVYVVTALPATSLLGGPARFEVVDLRSVDQTLDLTLDSGILVTADLGSFDRSSQATPIDTGSWAFAPWLIHPDRADLPSPDNLVNLSEPGECLGEPGLGCRIRRLVAGVGLPLTQNRQVRFAARDLGGSASKICLD